MSPRTPAFCYFDLGNVLLRFDRQVACRQIAEVAGVPAQQVHGIVFDDSLQAAYERGQLSTDQFYNAFCARSGTSPAAADLLRAASDIFEVDREVVGIVGALRRHGLRLGILSNTCDAHWRFLAGERFPILRELFEVAALSFRLGSLKPEPEIYEAAARMAAVRPEEIFFVDDRADNVAGALAVGFDAIQFTTASDLRTALAHRGLAAGS